MQAPASALTVPAALASSVLTITGIDTTTHLVRPNKATHVAAPPPAGFRNARPCSRYFGQVLAKFQADFHTPLPTFNGKTLPYAPCGYTGPQFRAAYEGNTTLDGTGVTVAITDAYAAPTIASDANTYAVQSRRRFVRRRPVHAGTARLVHACDATAARRVGTARRRSTSRRCTPWLPASKIRYYPSRSCFDSDFIDTLALVVDENKLARH